MGRRKREEGEESRDKLIDKVRAAVLEMAKEAIPGKEKAHLAAKKIARILDDSTHTGLLDPFDDFIFRAIAFAVVEIAYKLLKAEGADV